MKTTITARKFEITNELRSYIEKKFSKLDKFFSDDAQARITMSVDKEGQRAEATIYSQNTIYRVD